MSSKEGRVRTPSAKDGAPFNLEIGVRNMILRWQVTKARTALALSDGQGIYGAVKKSCDFYLGFVAHHKGNITLDGIDVDVRLLGAYPSVKMAGRAVMNEVLFRHKTGRFQRILEQ